MLYANAEYYSPITLLVKRRITKLGDLVIKPFTKWKDAIERFDYYSKSEYQKLSIIRSEEFIKVIPRQVIRLTGSAQPNIYRNYNIDIEEVINRFARLPRKWDCAL